VFSRGFEVSVEELKKRMDDNEDFVLLDIREPFEYEICRLPGAKLIPMGEIPSHLNELEDEKDLIIYCHAGVRSLRVVMWLRQNGFTNAKNLTGGIDAWSCQIDPNVPRY
jgi:adenylyltransferase/sulfurtransferase